MDQDPAICSLKAKIGILHEQMRWLVLVQNLITVPHRYLKSFDH